MAFEVDSKTKTPSAALVVAPMMAFEDASELGDAGWLAIILLPVEDKLASCPLKSTHHVSLEYFNRAFVASLASSKMVPLFAALAKGSGTVR